MKLSNDFHNTVKEFDFHNNSAKTTNRFNTLLYYLYAKFHNNTIHRAAYYSQSVEKYHLFSNKSAM